MPRVSSGSADDQAASRQGFDLIPFAMTFSAADVTLLRIRFVSCGQHTEKLVTVLSKKASIPCAICRKEIDLKTSHNALLIKETEESCRRIGEALTKIA